VAIPLATSNSTTQNPNTANTSGVTNPAKVNEPVVKTPEVKARGPVESSPVKIESVVKVPSVNVNSNFAHPFVKQVLNDSNRIEIQNAIINLWQSEKHKGQMKVYINLHEKVKNNAVQERKVKELKTMVSVLRKNDFPAWWTLVSLAESAITSNALSDKGAYGWWQFMPRTAVRFGLKVDQETDQRTDLTLSTQAAAEISSVLIQKFSILKVRSIFPFYSKSLITT
jgi:hypothetical protein